MKNPRSAIQAHIDRSGEIFKFSVYFIKTKAHICINKLACHRGYFVGLLFREISLKREETT